MFIESSPHDKYMGVLSLSSFPKNVLDFQESQVFFQQIIFVDYQLMLIIQHEFSGKIFARSSPSRTPEITMEKISDLITYAQSVDANYSSANKSSYEKLYFVVVLAHLYHLSSDSEGCQETLRSIKFNVKEFDSQNQADFIAYVTARYHALRGGSSSDSYSSWIDYLVNLKQYGSKSMVAANDWNDVIFKNMLVLLSSNGSSPLRFRDLLSQIFSDNACSLVAMANFAMRPENEKYILKEFRVDYISFLAELLTNKIKQAVEFPNASSDDKLDLEFVESLYESLNDISSHRPVITYFLKPSLSKKFLINMTEKTYQSQIVLLNLVRTLIDANEFDEAMGAFKTYATYVEKDAQQNNGQTPNILEVIDVYATCLYDFNPLRSIIPDSNSESKKFKYNTLESVVDDLNLFAKSLIAYLQKFTSIAELSYDAELGTFADNPLSFLFHRYNTNFLPSDKSKIVRILSKAWFSLGQFYHYLTIYGSADAGILQANISRVVLYYKNCLIINSTGSPLYLFNYAWALAQTQALNPAVRLCKFILKRYPESFKTWNLLVLVSSALEQEASSQESTAKNFDRSTILDSLVDEEKSKGEQDKDKATHVATTQLEKFIEDALNIAGLYMVKNRQNGVALTFRAKYEILQLKMTELAVWEANQGVEYILESVVEIFALYRELFQESIEDSGFNRTFSGISRAEGRWSHRPSVMDPADVSVMASKDKPKDKTLAKQRILRLSQVAQESSGKLHRTPSKVLRAPKTAAAVASKQDEELILQEIWLWTASIYLKLGLLEEAEQCIVEAETVQKPNVKTFTYLGLLTSKSRKFLSLQEYERSLEVFHTLQERYNKKAYGTTLLGMCKLFITDDQIDNSLFISSKDRDAGLIRLKNYLEQYSLCWPYGANSPELWYYLSTIYEKFDDKVLYKKALWKCVELETTRPVRSYAVCDDFY